MAEKGTCRSCHEEVLWAVTPQDKRVPLNVKPEKRVILTKPEDNPGPRGGERALVVDAHPADRRTAAGGCPTPACAGSGHDDHGAARGAGTLSNHQVRSDGHRLAREVQAGALRDRGRSRTQYPAHACGRCYRRWKRNQSSAQSGLQDGSAPK